MQNESVKRLAGLMAIGLTGQGVGRIIKERCDAAIAAETKRAEDNKRVPVECYINDVPGKGPTEVSVVPLSQKLSTQIEGKINHTTHQKEDMKAWKKKHGLT